MKTRVKHNSEGCEKLEKVVMDSIVKIDNNVMWTQYQKDRKWIWYYILH